MRTSLPMTDVNADLKTVHNKIYHRKLPRWL